MLYTVYKTTSLVNGKYYFGVHKTDDPYDGYLGSGYYIKLAIAKYGENNFCKEVLFVYLDPKSAFGKERELIQCWRSIDPLCKNIRDGGAGCYKPPVSNETRLRQSVAHKGKTLHPIKN